MDVREQVRDALRRGEYAALARRAAQEPRILRALLGRLWDGESEVRAGAAQTLGAVAAQAPEKATELVRRFLWALNEESGTNGAAVVPALAAMARNAPGVVGPFFGALVARLEDATLRAELFRVVEAFEATAPTWIAPHADEVARWRAKTSGLSQERR